MEKLYTVSKNKTGTRLFHREQSEAGPGLHAPPRSKPLRFSPAALPTPDRRLLFSGVAGLKIESGKGAEMYVLCLPCQAP